MKGWSYTKYFLYCNCFSDNFIKQLLHHLATQLRIKYYFSKALLVWRKKQETKWLLWFYSTDWLQHFSIKYSKSTHCLKSVRIRSYSGPHFPPIFPHADWIRRDTGISPNSVWMREDAGKMRTRTTPNTDTF